MDPARRLRQSAGHLYPRWWNENWNQYGQLKFLSVDHAGSYIDGIRRSGITLRDLNIGAGTALTLRLSAPADAKHCGGLTIFGRSFGNYNQDIKVRMEYTNANEPKATTSP